MGKEGECAVYSLINEQIRIAWFKIGIEIWALSYGGREERISQQFYYESTKGPAHIFCISCKECSRHKYKNRKLLINGIIETKGELHTP
jgi:hypothetical protein